MFGTFLAVLGAAPYPEPGAPADHGAHTPWGEPGLRAVNTLNAVGRDRRDADTGRDRDFLVDQLRSGRREVREANAAAHLLALLALHAVEPDHRLVTDGIDAVLRLRDTDAGIPFMPDCTVYLGSVAGLALARCDTDRHRELLTRIAEHLVAHQNPDGGWGFTEGVRQNDVDSSGSAVEFLQHLAPDRYSRTITRGRRYLAGMANTDGGFPTYPRDTQNPDGRFGHRPGDDSDPISTAHSVAAGTTLGRPPWHSRAFGYLLRHQQPDGGFHSTPDQVGPRPIPYDLPSLANAFVLTALSDTTG
ncbi:prenyltransferase/squalene oxidase repeat-containing protein [Actinosynnema sp. NPDC059797]